VLLGAHRTRREAEESLRTTRQSLDDSTLKDKLIVYPPWADRQVYSTGTTLMSIVEARRLINDERKRFPPSAAVTRFY
jgi:hypothetical protein